MIVQEGPNATNETTKRLWLEEDLGNDIRWSYRVSKVLFSGKSEFQDIDLVETPTFGKVRKACYNASPPPQGLTLD